MDIYIIVCPLTRKVWAYRTKELATKAAISKNKRDKEHPAFELWRTILGEEVEPSTAMYLGKLFRYPGTDFNKNDCWRVSEDVKPTEPAVQPSMGNV